MCAAIAPARALAGDLAQASSQRGVAVVTYLVALRGAVLAGDPTRPPLRQAEALLEHQDRPAPARRALYEGGPEVN